MGVNGLYSYRVTGREQNQIHATLLINADHQVYGGHFPGYPVTPGVCQLMMIRDILEGELRVPLMLTGAKQIKFTAVHMPLSEPEIDATLSFSISGDQLEVTARLIKNEKVFIKFQGEFREQKKSLQRGI
jgi:3-hydroxyacyl-[acyl-carrier-protein] dehydratase